MSSPYFSRPSSRRFAASKALAALDSSTSKRSTRRNISSSKQNKPEGHQGENLQTAQAVVKIEYDETDSNAEIVGNEKETKTCVEVKQEEGSSKRKIKSKSIKTVSPKKEKTDGDVFWEPANWRDLLEKIKLMRINEDAPVDSQGCERTADENESPEVIRFQLLVSLMLSAQTKDQITYAAMEKLKAHGLNPQSMLKTDEDLIGKLIYPVGFWKRKAHYIKQVSEICMEKYHGDIPETLEGLLSLPGVGPKMAHICMLAAWKKMTGIGVDTHVHRISNRLGWVKKMTKTPEDTRKALESWLPREEWETINILLVGFGQQTCLPVKPKCSECLARTICPYGKAALHGRKPSN
eukprot:gene9349-10336_t